MNVKIITNNGNSMEPQSPSNDAERLYCINIDKLPDKIQVKIKHIHRKSIRGIGRHEIRRGKSFRTKGTLFQTYTLFRGRIIILLIICFCYLIVHISSNQQKKQVNSSN